MDVLHFETETKRLCCTLRGSALRDCCILRGQALCICCAKRGRVGLWLPAAGLQDIARLGVEGLLGLSGIGAADLMDLSWIDVAGLRFLPRAGGGASRRGARTISLFSAEKRETVLDSKEKRGGLC